MITHVIILAQGQQKRLPTLTLAKQMLPLPACGDTPILHRTIRQLWHLLEMRPRFRPEEPQRELITVVGWLPLCEELSRVGVPVVGKRYEVGTILYCPDVCMLADPGNSSLRGIARYLSKRGDHFTAAADFGAERTVVLFGDVVYSWRCLRAILDGTHWNMGFVGTGNLSTNDGELWGVSWKAAAEGTMLHCLDGALEKHPPFTEYQPGQMRRWLWMFDAFMRQELKGAAFHPRNWYVPVDDYTRDIDLPEHVEMLRVLSEQAAVDDAANGVTW